MTESITAEQVAHWVRVALGETLDFVIEHAIVLYSFVVVIGRVYKSDKSFILRQAANTRDKSSAYARLCISIADEMDSELADHKNVRDTEGGPTDEAQQ